MPTASSSEVWSRKSRRMDRTRQSFSSLREFLILYLVRQPIAAVATVWLVCFPLLYYVYNDLLRSAETMVAITALFLFFLMIVIVVMVTIAVAVEYAFSRTDRWKRRR